MVLAAGAVSLLAAVLVGASPESAPLLSPYDVQRTESGSSPYAGSRVTVAGVVTAISPHGLFYYIADPSGGEWSGLKVAGAALRRSVGERVSVTGEVVEYFGETRLSEWSARGFGSAALPEPSPARVLDLVVDGEPWEGVLIRVDDALVIGETSRYGEFPIRDDSGVRAALVDDEFHTWYIADPGDRFESITGIVAFGFGDFLLEPRSDDDLVGWTSGRDFDAEMRFTIVDGGGAALPCKVTFLPADGSALHLGPDDRAEGSDDVAYLPNGEGTVRLPSGTYDIVVSRGIEYGLHEERIVVAPGGSPHVAAILAREVDSAGWMSGDFHLHSAPSSDSPVGSVTGSRARSGRRSPRGSSDTSTRGPWRPDASRFPGRT
jgi:hypothetical protein